MKLKGKPENQERKKLLKKGRDNMLATIGAFLLKAIGVFNYVCMTISNLKFIASFA
jgi:hypothetical protein